ncbi:hypothetical protein K0M31_017308 [Melipona bicolor]|uniref:Uncharacterized protein n=1 Tax=Melipona bicolor TaxID=60889 RepID=A0AA40G4N5_9HYME|nr:hypothetical protein K0M31_017308 [Melipona bicolor]
MQHNSMVYRNNERGRSMGVGPMRSRPMEKRHDTSPYSGVPYLSPPPPDTWRRTNSDSALHQSANEACQSATTIPHRRDQHAISGSGSDNRDLHYGFIERPRSSCEIPRVPGSNIDPSSQPPGQQIPIGNTRSLPDLVHFPSDQEDHSSSTPFSNTSLQTVFVSYKRRVTSNLARKKSLKLATIFETFRRNLCFEMFRTAGVFQSRQTSSPTNLSPTSLPQAGRLSFPQDQTGAQNHLSVPVNSRFLHTCKGVALENSTSTSQQDLQSYPQQPVPQPPTATSHNPPGHYIYQQPHSPVPPQSPKSSQQPQLNSLGSYRSSQQVNRPSPQSSPGLTIQGSPLSYSNNPSAPPSPTGHPGPPNLTENIDQNSYFLNQAQAAALQQDFEQFTMVSKTRFNQSRWQRPSAFAFHRRESSNVKTSGLSIFDRVRSVARGILDESLPHPRVGFRNNADFSQLRVLS